MIFTGDYLSEQLQSLPDTTRWLVGLSGGMDSMALLHALLAMRNEPSAHGAEASRPRAAVVAVHINHGLSPHADQWAEHCAAVCRDWKVPLHTLRVSVENRGKGIEDAARQARYEAMASVMEQSDVLLLGHHQDDQAETLLFRLMRGAGPYGLSAMSRCRAFSLGYIGRPLLDVPRSALRDYANAHGLRWVEDESNQQHNFDRNYLRLNVMPKLEERWPNFAQRWQRTAVACQQADQMAHDLSLLDLERCDEQKERWGYSLCFASLSALPRYRRHNLLRNWVRARGYAIMEHKHLHEAEKQFFEANASGAAVQWSRTALRLFNDRLFLTGPSPDIDWASQAPVTWDGSTAISLPDGSLLSAVSTHRQPALRPQRGVLSIRWRQGGERCQPANRGHSQTLKKLLHEYGVEPWFRERIPLIYVDDTLAAVGDLWVCKDFATDYGERGVALRWQLDD